MKYIIPSEIVRQNENHPHTDTMLRHPYFIACPKYLVFFYLWFCLNLHSYLPWSILNSGLLVRSKHGLLKCHCRPYCVKNSRVLGHNYLHKQRGQHKTQTAKVKMQTADQGDCKLQYCVISIMNANCKWDSQGYGRDTLHTGYPEIYHSGSRGVLPKVVHGIVWKRDIKV